MERGRTMAGSAYLERLEMRRCLEDAADKSLIRLRDEGRRRRRLAMRCVRTV